MRQIICWVFAVCSMAAQAQSALNSRQFKKYWRVESESPDYRMKHVFLSDNFC